MIDHAELELVSTSGTVRGLLTVTCLREKEQWRHLDSIVDLRGSTPAPALAAPVQLLEEMSYSYTIESGSRAVAHIEPSENFSSTRNLSIGRFEAKRSTGTITVTVDFDDGSRARCELEVRSRKLDYESDYRSMLQRIAREAAELVQAAFAPSSVAAFRPNTADDPKTLYQRFAFMRALVTSEEVDDALHLIVRRPHHAHIAHDVVKDPAKSVRSTAGLAAQLVRPGARFAVDPPVAGLSTLPRRIIDTTHETTFDTVPNRFVKHVLTRWRDLANEVARQLTTLTPSNTRGRREATDLDDSLTRSLATPALAEAGPLHAFPESNPVLQGRAGYREVLEAFLLAESAALIDWDDRDRIFDAGQRNVAELYEYWVFLEIVRIVEALPGFTGDRSSLIRVDAGGLSLNLRRDGQAVVKAKGVRRGTNLILELSFNRRFEFSRSLNDGSWTEALQPDCSICIRPAGRRLAADTWVHFDAKYKVDRYTSGFKADPPSDAEATTTDIGHESEKPVSGDLIKMHAYRDAIRRSAGAYVLYPGDDDARRPRYKQYHEILPGLGAFVLRPGPDGVTSAASTEALSTFLEDVIDHVAAQGTAAERIRYWTGQTTADTLPDRLDFHEALEKPPADTPVLLGFVRSPTHLAWYLVHGLYNLRADEGRFGSVGIRSPELGADFLLLYDSSTDVTTLCRLRHSNLVLTSAQLIKLGYPQPHGQVYICPEFDPAPLRSPVAGERARVVARQGRDRTLHAAPRLVRWSDLVDSPVTSAETSGHHGISES